MDSLTRTEFERCAISSGLLSKQQLDEEISALRWSSGDEPDQQPSADCATAAESLAARLVERGLLNPWQAKQLLEGQTRFNLGPYRIIDSVGSGGMGQVFRARHVDLGLEVAIKVLPRDKSTPESVESFAREAQAQASLDHENLVKALDGGYDGRVYYLVSEYVPGSDLRKLVRQTGPLDMQAAACIISQVARGLAHAHQRGLVHRDVKPGNVLVTPDGRAKLSDLGLAGPMGGDDKSDPRRGKIVGTPDYISPDHIKAPWAPTPAWDIYSLGCTLYYAVTSKVPFPGGTVGDKARAHCHMRPLDPRRLNPSLSPQFVDVLADMMAKEPSERISDAKQVEERLAPWAGVSVPIPAAAFRAAASADSTASGVTTFVVPASQNRPIAPTDDPHNIEDTADGLPQLASFSGVPPAKKETHSQLPQPADDSESQSQVSQATHAIASGHESTFSDLTLGNKRLREVESSDSLGLSNVFQSATNLSKERIRNILLIMLAPLAILGIVLSLWHMISWLLF